MFIDAEEPNQNGVITAMDFIDVFDHHAGDYRDPGLLGSDSRWPVFRTQPRLTRAAEGGSRRCTLYF